MMDKAWLCWSRFSIRVAVCAWHLKHKSIDVLIFSCWFQRQVAYVDNQRCFQGQNAACSATLQHCSQHSSMVKIRFEFDFELDFHKAKFSKECLTICPCAKCKDKMVHSLTRKEDNIYYCWTVNWNVSCLTASLWEGNKNFAINIRMYSTFTLQTSVLQSCLEIEAVLVWFVIIDHTNALTHADSGPQIQVCLICHAVTGKLLDGFVSCFVTLMLKNSAIDGLKMRQICRVVFQ